MKMVKLGDHHITPYGLAPMAGVTDYPFRKLCYEYKAPFCFTEMINARAVIEENPKTLDMLPKPDEPRTAIQLFGSDYRIIYEVAKRIENLTFWIDINSACPVRKVMKTGSGAALLKEPQKLYDIAKVLKENISIPVSFKLRKTDNLLEVCLKLQEIGVDLVTIHGRTVQQGYSGKADWEFAYRIKEELSIPVFLSGDIFDVEAVAKALQMGFDGVLIARGARERPMIFEQLHAFFTEGKIKEYDDLEVIKMMRKHFQNMLDFYGEERGVRKYKAFGIAFSKNLKSSKYFRDRLKLVEKADQVFRLIDELELSIKERIKWK